MCGLLATAPKMAEVKVPHAGKPYCSRLTISAASNGAEVGEKMNTLKASCVAIRRVKWKKERRRKSSAKRHLNVFQFPRMTETRFAEHLTKHQY